MSGPEIGRTVVFGDVHGNLPAFEAMLRHAGAADRFVCLGDVVNYGPWSNECVDLLDSLPNCDKLIGNHEVSFLAGCYQGSNQLARQFHDFCSPKFHRHVKLKEYRESAEVGTFRAQHTLGNRYLFADTPVEIEHDYLVGHSHHQFRRTIGDFELVNAGSVGQNRRHLNVINYVVIGPGPREVELVALEYDPSPLVAEMRRLEYPGECIAYYLGKLGGRPQT